MRPFSASADSSSSITGQKARVNAFIQSKSSFESRALLGHKGDMKNKADVIIIGGGLIGLTQALALAAQGITSHVIDRADQANMLEAGFDGRTFAISS